MLNFDKPHLAGILPLFADEADPRPLVEQLDASYAHGGGWHSFSGFSLVKFSNGKYGLEYPQDPAMHEVTRASFRNQLVVLFEYEWVGIIEDDKLVDVARMN